MHALVLNHQTKFEVPIFTISKDMIKAKVLKTGHMTMNMPLLWVVCRL